MDACTGKNRLMREKKIDCSPKVWVMLTQRFDAIQA